MATLPDVSQSCVQMAITWHLGRAQPDAVSNKPHHVGSESADVIHTLENRCTQDKTTIKLCCYVTKQGPCNKYFK